MALSLLPALDGALVLLMCLASASIVIALVLSLCSALGAAGARGKVGVGIAILAVFAITALLTYGLTEPGSSWST